MKGKLVAVRYNDKKECVDLLDVKTLDAKEYAKYLADFHKVEEADIEHNKKHDSLSEDLTKHAELLDLYRLCLAKSLYDNYVDRGIIDEDNDFQKDFADFLFRGAELRFEETPVDFKKIYERLGK